MFKPNCQYESHISISLAYTQTILSIQQRDFLHSFGAIPPSEKNLTLSHVHHAFRAKTGENSHNS